MFSWENWGSEVKMYRLRCNFVTEFIFLKYLDCFEHCTSPFLSAPACPAAFSNISFFTMNLPDGSEASPDPFLKLTKMDLAYQGMWSLLDERVLHSHHGPLTPARHLAPKGTL